MGKSKKDKKNRQESDPEDELVTQTAAISIKDGEGKNEKGDGAPQKQKKKDKKKKDKGKVESDDEEDGITALAQNIGVTGSKKQKPTGFSAFQMLQDDDDDEAGSMSESDGEEEDKLAKKPSTKETTNNVQNEDEPMETSSAPAQKNKKKKGKKGKQEEEDIDAILAEIEKPAEKEGKKKKKGKKEEKDEGNEAEETPEPTPQPAENEKGGPKLIDFSAMTQEEIAAMFDEEEEEEDDRKKKKKKKKGKKGAAAEEEEKEEEGEEQGEEGQEEQEEGTVKTAAQKKKEKKERQRLQKLQQKKKGPQKKEDADDGEKEDKKEEKEVKEDAKVTESAEPKKEQSEEKAKEPSVEKTKEPSVEKEGQAEGEEKGSDDEGETDKKKKKRDKKKKKDEKEKEKEVKKKPGSKQLKLIQEMQQLKKEEEERLIREEEEKERRIEEARRLKEEEEKKKAEKKEKEKQKKKERIERAKAEGRYLTPKQKEAQKRAQQLVEALQAQGVNVPLPGQAAEDRPKKKPLYTRKKKPQKQQETDKSAGDTSAPSSAPETPLIEENKLIEDLEKQTQEAAETKVEEVKEEPKEAWDMSSGDEEEEEEAEDKEDSEPKSEEAKKPEPVEISVKDSKEEEDQEEEEEEEDNEEESEEGSSEEEESSEEESSDESSSEEDEKLTPAEKTELRLKKTRERIKKRKEANEAKRTTDHLRAPVVCVLGHVDTGKTKILDKLRRTHVQDGEAGGITQQIGATNVPADCILEQTRMCKEFAKKELKIPGLLIIDTPGHESFSNLRTRGSGLCDIAVLVVDIMHGLEPQTIESINLLKSRKTPFVIALNKIDRLYGWQSSPGTDVHSALKKQKQNTKLEFDERAKSVIVQMAEQGLNTALFYENKNPREYISLVPTSAHSGDGMGSLIALICELCQSMLAKRLAYSEELQAVAMEVKAIPGLGTTVDVILVNGKMREGQQIVLAGTEGPIVTQIRGLLMPQPLRELRVKNAYTRNKEVVAAQGVKVIAKDMEKALAGLPVFIAENQDEVEVYRQEIEDLITDVLDSIKVQEKGVYVQASTLGSLEALLEFLKTSKIPFAGINIGPVHKRDVMKASTMLERDSQYAVILAFDVKVERDAQEFADSVGVRIFTADIIYHLFDAFMGYREELKRAKQDEFKHLCVFPAKLKILPNCVFNSRDPIVVGVVVEAGFIKEGTPLCVPAKQFVDIGRVSSIEFNHKPVEIARKGNEVCIKIDPIPGDAPKMVGRHFEETDQLVSKISRQSIDVVKNYFRDDMSKTDWQLIMELKKTFSIL